MRRCGLLEFIFAPPLLSPPRLGRSHYAPLCPASARPVLSHHDSPRPGPLRPPQVGRPAPATPPRPGRPASARPPRPAPPRPPAPRRPLPVPCPPTPLPPPPGPYPARRPF